MPRALSHFLSLALSGFFLGTLVVVASFFGASGVETREEALFECRHLLELPWPCLLSLLLRFGLEQERHRRPYKVEQGSTEKPYCCVWIGR